MKSLKSSELPDIICFVILLFPLTIFQFFSTEILVNKIFFIAATGMACLLFAFTNKWPLKINARLSGILLLLYLWQFFKSVPLDCLGAIVLLNCCFLYWELSSCKDVESLYKAVPVIAVLLVAEVIFFLLPVPNGNNFFAPNNSVFSILLAAQVAFILPFFYKHVTVGANKNLQFLLFLLSGVLIFLLLFKTGGRSGILALAIVICIFISLKFKIQQKLLKVSVPILIAIVFAVLFFYKANSSNGRLMIYKIVLKEATFTEWVTGIGFGQFKVKYNQWQASYFAENPYYNTDVPYAENIYYSFNDPFQMVLELGVMGLILLLFFTYYILKRFKKDARENKLNNDTLLGAYLCLFSFGISSLFSYPFQVVCMYPLFIIALAIVSINNDRKKVRFDLNFKVSYFIRILIFLGLVLIAGGILTFRNKLETAREFSRSKFRKKAIENYQELSKGIIWDKSIFFSYASELQKVKKQDSAILLLNKSAKYIYNDLTAKLFAELYFEKGMADIAETYYKQAVYINPKSYRNRFLLMTFYLENGQKGKAKETGEFILSMPYRPNEKVNLQIRKQVKTALLQLLKSDNSQPSENQ